MNRFHSAHQGVDGILNRFHSAHQGVDGILRRARQTVYWSGLDHEIQRMCSSCNQCIKNSKPLTKEELIIPTLPMYPFQKVVSNLFSLDGHQYLIYADRLTGWPEVAYFNTDPTSHNNIGELRGWFQRFGVPMQISFDGGPNISSKEIESFLTKWGSVERKSSAYYPKSNGRAEATTVKSMTGQ